MRLLLYMAAVTSVRPLGRWGVLNHIILGQQPLQSEKMLKKNLEK